jgi:hypothetical protein
LVLLDACRDSTTPSPSKQDGSASARDGAAADATPDAGPDLDASCPMGKTLPATGETCIGFGKGSPCDPACGLGEYGYVCFNGGPPGFAGCVQASSTGSFGDTYCCPDNACVPQPDQDDKCTAPGKSHRYQCPPDVTAPSGCAAVGSGSTALERFYCCP